MAVSEKTKKVASVISTVLVVLFLLVAVLSFAVVAVYRLRGEDAQIFGYQLRIVVSGSMELAIPTRSLVAVRTDSDDTSYEEGDILTFYYWSGSASEVIVTHRVISVREENGDIIYTLRGDAVENDTQEVSASSGDIIGKVEWSSAAAGQIVSFLCSPAGIVSCLIVPASAVLVYEIVRAVLLLRGAKIKKLKDENSEREREVEALRRELEELKNQRGEPHE